MLIAKFNSILKIKFSNVAKEVVIIKFYVETTKYLSGEVESLNCELIAGEEYYTILKHTILTELQVGKCLIAPGNVTYRFHWPNRSYNLLKFFNPAQALIANYFHLVDSVELTEAEVLWRDLNVAVLVLPDGETQLITGNNRPALSETWLHIFIAANTQELLRKYQDIIAETDRMLQKHAATTAI
jgi:hypothetical protein